MTQCIRQDGFHCHGIEVTLPRARRRIIALAESLGVFDNSILSPINNLTEAVQQFKGSTVANSSVAFLLAVGQFLSELIPFNNLALIDGVYVNGFIEAASLSQFDISEIADLENTTPAEVESAVTMPLEN